MDVAAAAGSGWERRERGDSSTKGGGGAMPMECWVFLDKASEKREVARKLLGSC